MLFAETKYPFQILPEALTKSEKLNCPNKALVEKGFWINREFVGKKLRVIKFTASIEPNGEEMSHLRGEKGDDGECNDVVTKPNSRRCGLAKYLMWICFQDDEILGKQKRGVNPLTHKYWKDERQKIDADQYCEKITYLDCLPEIEEDDEVLPNIVCVSYMRGAIKASFNVLFVYADDVPFEIFNLEKVEAKFGKKIENAEEFIEDHGYEWFFCKCKANYMTNCMAMITGKIYFFFEFRGLISLLVVTIWIIQYLHE